MNQQPSNIAGTARWIGAGALVWAGVIVGFGLASLSEVNSGAVWIVATAIAICAAAAVGSAAALATGRPRLAGGLLLMSAAAPTFAAAAVNLIPLAFGLSLLIRPSAVTFRSAPATS